MGKEFDLCRILREKALTHDTFQDKDHFTNLTLRSDKML